MRFSFIFLLFLSIRYAGCFVTTNSKVLIKKNNAALRLHMTRAAVESDNAILNLEKLRQHQIKELKETESLIKALSDVASNEEESDRHNENVDDLASDFDDLTHYGALDLGASLQMGTDYGFRSRSEGAQLDETSGGFPINGYNMKASASEVFEDYGPPTNIFALGSKAFMRNLNAIRGVYDNEDRKNLTEKQLWLQTKLRKLKLNSALIWEREKENTVEAPLVIKIPYFVLCFFLDFVFEGRYVPSRFYLLETVARMPYFSYISMLHLYETLGWWRRSADVKRIHFAEEWNEYHHLLIMESLGGDQEWWVRFASYHAALLYYSTLVVLWCLSPTLSYKFSELLETHAVNTYSQLLDENEKLLKELPPSLAAVEYYCLDATDPLFAEYQTSSYTERQGPRRPGENMRSLYDVFAAIREDEGDHVSTMKACLDPKVALQTPSIERRILAGGAVVAAIAYAVSTNDFSSFDFSGITGDELNVFIDEANEIDPTSIIAGATAIGKQMLENEGDPTTAMSDLFMNESVDNFFMLRQLIVRVLEEVIKYLR